MRKFDFDYDIENDDLFIFNRRKKASGSIEFGNLVLDFDKDKNISGIEILEATKYLNELIAKGKLNKEMIANMASCMVETKSHDNLLIVKLVLLIGKREFPFNMSIPKITQSSPALMCH